MLEGTHIGEVLAEQIEVNVGLRFGSHIMVLCEEKIQQSLYEDKDSPKYYYGLLIKPQHTHVVVKYWLKSKSISRTRKILTLTLRNTETAPVFPVS